MELMNRYLPEYQFAEEHSRCIPAPPGRVLDVVGHPDVVDDPVARALISLRDALYRLTGRRDSPATPQDRSAFGLADFTFLGRDGDRELAYGLAGRFWQRDFGLVAAADATAFGALDQSGIAILVMNFTAQAVDSGTRLTTRTRVWCSNESTRRSFRPYWMLIRPASGLIRRRLLKRVHNAAMQGFSP